MNVATVAPELSDALLWINCGPHRLEEQKGRVVALVFWQAGSIWSQNLLTDMQALQRTHAESMTVIGIHTPKFEAERNPRLVLKAVNRMELQFPMAVDNDFITWQHYGIEAWPSVVLLDTRGHRAGVFVGDQQRPAIESMVSSLLEATDFKQRSYESQGAHIKQEPPLPLAFPSGIAVGANHLYIADSGHHRLLECTLEGRILRTFGTGNPALIDGPSGEASFRFPRGLFLSRDTLYVADTDNHALRAVRLLDGYVETLAGNGRRGALQGSASGRAETMALNSPWSLTGNFDRLYIAMTGAQQIWEYNQSNRSLNMISGSGQLGLVDGGPHDACYAQPAGIALIDQTLYIADSATSAIRTLHVPSGRSFTMIGRGLFEFGAQDGGRSQGRLQFPCSLAPDPRSPMLWVADSYNNTLRLLRLTGGELRHHDLGYRLHEPAAIAVSSGVLWIANSNAHEILRCELSSNSVRRLPIGE